MKKTFVTIKNNFKNVKKISKKNMFIIMAILVVFVMGIIFVPRAFAQPVKSVELVSDTASFEDKTPGAWKVNKSAKWTSKGEAEITFDVESILKSRSKYTDVLFVLDISESMAGSKLDRVKDDTTELIESLLSNDGNRMGIITFDTESDIVTELTNDRELLLEKINGLAEKGRTNYYQALVNVDKILKNYVEEKDRELVVLFLTDGYPNEDTPNEVSQYDYLKKTYPFITINGVQYEMGNTLLYPLKQVSDNQFKADQSTLNNTLFDATITPKVYDKFEISDYINTDYFLVESEKDIEVEQGNVEFDSSNQKVIWKMDSFRSGSKTKMTIKIKLKDEFIGQGGVYPTNKSEEIYSKLGEVEDDIVSDKTPVLLDNYKVIYDGNAPDGSSVTGVPEEKTTAIFDVVGISGTIPVCEGYQFKGWEITTKDVKKVNNDYFVMPEEDVVIKAKWSKLNITKSMTGTIKEKHTLYKQVENDANSNNHAKLYTGDTSTFNGKENVYYYYGETPNNNVLFGDFCWRMVRTTDTGGVKIIYNGEPDSEGKCGRNRGSHVGYGERTSQTLSSSYLYGTDYTYDEATNTFTLSGKIEIATWSDTTSTNLIGKYTCKNGIGSCETLYYVSEYSNSISAYTLPISSTTSYYEIGTSSFNASADSLANVGYMYNDVYTAKYRHMSLDMTLLSTTSLSTEYYYADDVAWDAVNKKYILLNPYKFETITDYQSLKGKYTLMNKSESYSGSSVYFITGATNSTIYYIYLYGGKELSDVNKTYVFSDSLIETEDGGYTLDLSKSISVKKSEWLDSYQKLKNLFYKNENGDIYFIASFNHKGFSYVNIADDFLYGNSFTYNEETGEYTLSGETQHFYDWMNNFNKLSNTHYTCWNVSGVCKKISYIFYEQNKSPYYIELENGLGIEAAIDDMLHNENVNVTDSSIKKLTDLWYFRNMLPYTEYLEDTIWCNSRRIITLGGWNPNGGSLTNYLYYWPNGNSSNLTCPDKIDSFTVSEDNGNGALKYPVGLITAQEQTLGFSSNGKYPIYPSSSNWTLSPVAFSTNGDANVYTFYAHGSLNKLSNVYEWYHSVRPVVSLRAGIEYLEGDGTIDHPYVIDMSS